MMLFYFVASFVVFFPGLIAINHTGTPNWVAVFPTLIWLAAFWNLNYRSKVERSSDGYR